jgi:hypothetical protein
MERRMEAKTVTVVIGKSDDGWSLTIGDGPTYIFERRSKLIARVEKAAEALEAPLAAKGAEA